MGETSFEFCLDVAEITEAEDKPEAPPPPLWPVFKLDEDEDDTAMDVLLAVNTADEVTAEATFCGATLVDVGKPPAFRTVCFAEEACPHRSENLWPKWVHSFSINTWKPRHVR